MSTRGYLLLIRLLLLHNAINNSFVALGLFGHHLIGLFCHHLLHTKYDVIVAGQGEGLDGLRVVRVGKLTVISVLPLIQLLL